MEVERSPTGTFIEGVGDEVVVLLSTLLMLFIPLALFLLNKGATDTQHEIHPENQERVEAARSRLRMDNTDSDGTDEDDGVNSDDSQENRQRFYTDHRCPICLQEARLPVETNCGHLFCSHCLITYWRYGNWLGAVNCPVCRQQVTLLLRNFSSAEATNTEPGRDAAENINDYNRRFSGQPRPLLDYIRDIPALMRHLWSEFFSMNGLVLMFRVRIVLCATAILLYLISPLDFMPEAVFGAIGFLDDVFVLMLLLVYMTVIYRNLVAARN